MLTSDQRDSSAQHALAALIQDGAARASGRRHQRRYHLAVADLAADLLRLARRYLSPQETLGALVRANPGVEFASHRASARELVVVYANDAADADEVRLQRTAGLVAPGVADPPAAGWTYWPVFIDDRRGQLPSLRRAA